MFRIGSPMKATRAVACLATLALIAASAACTSSATGSSGTGATSTAGSGTPSQPFKMYAFMALSGPLAAVGDAMKQGLEAGVDVINAHGGVFGKPMTLDVEDDAGDPTQAATLAQSLV